MPPVICLTTREDRPPPAKGWSTIRSTCLLRMKIRTGKSRETFISHRKPKEFLRKVEFKGTADQADIHILRIQAQLDQFGWNYGSGAPTCRIPNTKINWCPLLCAEALGRIYKHRGYLEQETRRSFRNGNFLKDASKDFFENILVRIPGDTGINQYARNDKGQVMLCDYNRAVSATRAGICHTSGRW